MATIDLKKVYREQYTAKVGKPALVEVPPAPHLQVDGRGDPNSAAEYQEALEALYPMVFGIRAAIKAETGDGYTVLPLEGLWWVDDMAKFSVLDKAAWHWTMMIRLPEVVTPDLAAAVIRQTISDKRPPAGERVRYASFGDGLAAQVLHVGPYADEGPTVELLHEFIRSQGLAPAGKHHEIYLGDPRKADPAKLKTIIRQPVRPTS